MSDQEHIRQLAELTTPLVIDTVEPTVRDEELWNRHKQALATEMSASAVFQEPPPEANPLATAATVYFAATAALSPLLEDLAATHMSRRKQPDPVERPGSKPRTRLPGAPFEPGE